MSNLIYSAITSLDGYIEDQEGRFEWSAPDEEVHAFVNDLERSIGTHLFGRRMYEVMLAWESLVAPEGSVMADFANVWRTADKIVYSTSLTAVSSARTRLEREFDPAAIRQLKESSGRDINVGGPGLAAQAIRAGLVDEYHFFVNPIVVGGGKPALPGNVRLALELVDERRFAGGVVHLHYRQ